MPENPGTEPSTTPADDDGPPVPAGSAPAAPPADDGSGTGRVAALRARVDEVRGNADWYRAEAERRYPPVGWALELWDRYTRLNAPALAGHLAFRAFSWLLPLGLILVAATGLAADQGTDVAEQAGTTLGLGQTLAASLEQASADTESSRLQLGFVAVSGLLLGTSGLLSALHLAYRTLWEVPDRRVRGRGRLLGRLLGGAPLLVVIIAASSALRRAGLLGGLAGVALSLAVIFAMLLGLAWILPRRATELRDLVIGPAVGTGLFAGLQAFTTLYLVDKLSKMSDTYGAMGITVTFLVYLYLVGQIVVLAALVNATTFDLRASGARWPRRSRGPDPTGG